MRHADPPAPPPQGALFRASADAPTLTVARLGITIRTLVSTAESGGTLAALEYAAPPAFRGPAPHRHARLTETFVGLEGAPVMQAGPGAAHVLHPGAVVVVPPGVVHAFGNPGTEPARFLVLASPGLGLERYFTTLAARYDTFPPPPPSSAS